MNSYIDYHPPHILSASYKTFDKKSSSQNQYEITAPLAGGLFSIWMEVTEKVSTNNLIRDFIDVILTRHETL